jgi:hypothetical protein
LGSSVSGNLKIETLNARIGHVFHQQSASRHLKPFLKFLRGGKLLDTCAACDYALSDLRIQEQLVNNHAHCEA